MKKVLIIGKNSYVGKNIKSWLTNYPEQFEVDIISIRNRPLEVLDFSSYDTICYVVGLAHIKETKKNRDLYFEINRDLTFEVAKKAKREKVGHFIFISSMSVYGMNKGEITKETPVKPKSYYGKSKFEAEKLISTLKSDSFNISIIRPPMIYGQGCRGNYAKLSKIARRSPFFPKVKNKRSMIYIGNLCELIKRIIETERGGVFCPQNEDYVNTSNLVSLIAKAHNNKIKLINIRMIGKIKIEVLEKAFGDLVYDKRLSGDLNEYNVFNFNSSVIASEVMSDKGEISK